MCGFVISGSVIMVSLRFAMMKIEPAATRSTMRTPSASARILLVLSGRLRRDVQKEHEMHAHLGYREDGQPQQNAGRP